jgi:hypothetical protein
VKNQYFGDVNDYLKYGLLRCFSHACWRVGVCWMLTPDDGSRGGGKIGYLSKDSVWRSHDPLLFDVLRSTISTGAPRDVAVVEGGSLIPNASFFSRAVPHNKLTRSGWFESALAALSSSDLLFFDPDNGLEVRSTPLGDRDSTKYLYWSEVRLAWERGASLLIFQHFPHENHQAYLHRLMSRLKREAAGVMVTPLRSTNVLFLLACQPQHESTAKAALELVRSRWQGRLNW